MAIRSRQSLMTLAAPLLSVGLLAGIYVEQTTHLKPQDAEPYHDRAKAAVAEVPYFIGTWTGQDDEIPLAAQKLLRPNAILSRTFVDSTPPKDYRSSRRIASLLVVQCRDSRDMVGHYPPICYRAQGRTPDEKNTTPRDWTVNGKQIPGYEYQFVEAFKNGARRTIVYNFLIVPGVGIARDMKGVERAAEDHQKRHYGAAQFQVVFQSDASAELPREERDEIFATLMGPNIQLVETLTSSGALQ